MKKNIPLLLILFITAFLNPLSAQDLPDPMSPPRLVNDFAKVLPADQAALLEQKLFEFNNQTSTQIYVVTVSDLHGYEKADYTTRLAEKWGVGQKGKDNGIMMLIKPKTAREKGEIFIAVGYGLEGVVPDAVTNRIIRNEILPAFKNGDYFTGINQGINTLMKLTAGEFTADEYLKETGRSPASRVGGLVFFVFLMLMLFSGRSTAARHRSLGGNLPFWILMGMMGSSFNSHQGSFNNFSSGMGGFGGFGGGGGGSFGGGGAGGSW
ncbi:MAG: TPM domain-containing protein [Bacteroidales bacterium]|nr:TPM domain-containing protein [Bacteroidales bacterium]